LRFTFPVSQPFGVRTARADARQVVEWEQPGQGRGLARPIEGLSSLSLTTASASLLSRTDSRQEVQHG
jgi:hypothetical protein